MKSILTLSLFILLFAVCNGCKDKTSPYYSITDQRLRDGVNFKVGSYFIYQDSASGSTDSFGVSVFVNQNVHNNDNNSNYEFINYIADNPNTGNISAAAGGGAAMNKIGASISIGNEFFHNIYFVKLPFTTGETEDNGTTYHYTYIQHYDSLQILGVYYKDVYEVESRVPDYIHSYYSIKSGLIKFATSTSGSSHVWNAKKIVVVN